MRKLSGILAACALLFAIASTAQAKTLEWRGTQIFVLGAAVGPISTGTGVATVNGSGGLGHLSTLRVAGGISGSTTIPTTDPAITVIRLATGLGTGTLAPISGGGPLLPPNRTLPITGTFSMGVRVAPGFTVPLVLPLTVNGTRGIGIGGTITATVFGSPVMVLQGSPWTLGVVTFTTSLGGVISMQGFVHGPVSGTSSTAQQSGVIVMLSPGQVIAGSEPPAPVLAALRLHFIPEPRFVLLLGSGIAGLVVIGRHRMRK